MKSADIDDAVAHPTCRTIASDGPTPLRERGLPLSVAILGARAQYGMRPHAFDKACRESCQATSSQDSEDVRTHRDGAGPIIAPFHFTQGRPLLLCTWRSRSKGALALEPGAWRSRRTPLARRLAAAGDSKETRKIASYTYTIGPIVHGTSKEMCLAQHEEVRRPVRPFDNMIESIP